MSDTFRNLSVSTTGVVRVENFDGREHLIVPVVALMEGVIHAVNAPYPEFVPLSTLSMMPHSWNGRPLVLRHPVREGRQISANEVTVLESQAFGQIFNARVAGSKLLMDAYVDVAKAEKVMGVEMLDRIRAGQVCEVSVGAFVTTDNSTGSYEGKPYKARWQSLAPDHLAFLPEGRGACSVSMGCGSGRMAAGKDGYMDDCPKCGGSGNVDGNPCEACKSEGQVKVAAEAVETERPIVFLEVNGDVISQIAALGGPGSGNFGHDGRPGKRGGSSTSSSKAGDGGVGGGGGHTSDGKRKGFEGGLTDEEARAKWRAEGIPVGKALKPGTPEYDKMLDEARKHDRKHRDEEDDSGGEGLTGDQGRKNEAMDAQHHAKVFARGIEAHLSPKDPFYPKAKAKLDQLKEMIKKGDSMDKVEQAAEAALGELYDLDRITPMMTQMKKMAHSTSPLFKGKKIRGAATSADEDNGNNNITAACGCNGDKRMYTNDEKTAVIKTLIECKHSGFAPGDEDMLELASDERLEQFKVAADARRASESQLKAAGAQPMTEEEFMQIAPPSFKALIARQQKQEIEQKTALVTALRAAQDEYNENELAAMPIGDLERLARATKVTVASAVDFSGRGVVRTAAAAGDKDVYANPPDGYAIAATKLRAARAAQSH